MMSIDCLMQGSLLFEGFFLKACTYMLLEGVFWAGLKATSNLLA